MVLHASDLHCQLHEFSPRDPIVPSKCLQGVHLRPQIAIASGRNVACNAIVVDTVCSRRCKRKREGVRGCWH